MRYHDLDHECGAMGCGNRVDGVHTQAIVADTFIGLTGAAAITTVVLFVLRVAPPPRCTMRFLALVLLLGGCDALLDFDKLRHGHGDGGSNGRDGGSNGGDGGSACKVPAGGPFFDYAHPSEQALNQYAYAMTLADVGGQLEIVTLEGDNKLRTYTDVARAVKTTASMGTGCSAFNQNASLTSADFDGDKLVDLAVGCANTLDTPQADLDLLLGTAAGPFASAQPFASQATNPSWSTTADLDGDGSSDLIVVDTKSPAAAWTSTSACLPAAMPPRACLCASPLVVGRACERRYHRRASVPTAIPCSTCSCSRSIRTPARVTSRSSGATARTRGASPRTPEKVTIPEGDAVVIGAGNLDADGRPELLVADDSGSLYVFTGTKSADGTTSYTTPSSTLTTPTYSYQMAVGDPQL